MTKERLQLSIQTVKDNIAILESVKDSEEDAGVLLQLEHEKIVLNALEKQMPKKPLDIEKEYDGDYGNCPNCNRSVWDFDDCRICKGCGQALDWSDNNAE